jgi:hypothetical protein
MAAVVETVERDGKSVLVYDNGMEKDATTGRMMRPPTAALIQTSEQANAYQRRRQELKRERLLAGAAKTLERGGDWETPNDLDVVEALGEAVMMKALNPDSAKQVDAARFILQETGLAETQQQAGTTNNTVNVIAMPEDILHALNELRSRLNSGLDAESAISASNKMRIDETVIDAQDGSE